MKCTTINATPATFPAALEKLQAFFAKKGDGEATLCLGGGIYTLGGNVGIEHASDMPDETRDVREKNTHMLKSAKELKKYPEAVRIMNFSGCAPEIGKKEFGKAGK